MENAKPDPSKTVELADSNPTASINANEDSEVTTNVVNDVPYYRNLVKNNAESLNKLCDEWKIYEDTISEEVGKENAETILGDIRTCIGQAKLLMKERFSQFSGLIDKCEFGSNDKPVLCHDLQGFWDMVNFQVVDVQEKFSNLKERKNNNWPKTEPEKNTNIKKRTLKRKSATNTTNEAKKIEAKKRLAAAKAALKKKVQMPSVTFDAGFFKVDSPVRSLRDCGRTPSTTERKRPATPSSDNFLHGRYLKRRLEAMTPELKKTLNFEAAADSIEQETSENVCKAPVVAAANEKRTISTETEMNEFNVERALTEISKQFNFVQNMYRTRETSTKSVQTLKEKTIKAEENHSNDSYKELYHVQLGKSKMLETQLELYKSVREKIPLQMQRLETTKKMIQEKVDEITGIASHLNSWKQELTLKEEKENEELKQLKETHQRNLEDLTSLRSHQEKFDEISAKLKDMEEKAAKHDVEHNKLQEECNLVRKERNELRDALNVEYEVKKDLETKLAEITEQRIFEKDELTNENNFLVEEGKLTQQQLHKTELMLQATKDVLEKLQIKYNDQKLEITEIKETQAKERDETKVLQEELDITKANSRLAIIEQQQDVIASESNVVKLNAKMKAFHHKLQNYLEEHGKREIQNIPPMTPGKSLVVSALLGNAKDIEEMLEASSKQAEKPDDNLFTRISDLSSLIDDIMQTSANVAEHFETRMLQLSSEKNFLTKSVATLRQHAQQHADSKMESELVLQRRLREVMSQRDDLTQNWKATRNDNDKLIQRIQQLTEENYKYKTYMSQNFDPSACQRSIKSNSTERKCLEELNLQQTQNP